MTKVLIVGRSPGVLLEIVDRLRAHGYDAEATNQFKTVLDDYELGAVDVLVFGGAVPPETRQRIRLDAEEQNPRATVVQGLAGIAGVVVGQVLALRSSGAARATYDAATRSIRLELPHAGRATLEAFWGTFVPPEPTSESRVFAELDLVAGSHDIRLPDEVPDVTSFVVATVGEETLVVTIGEVRGVSPGTPLSAPPPVSTGV